MNNGKPETTLTVTKQTAVSLGIALLMMSGSIWLMREIAALTSMISDVQSSVSVLNTEVRSHRDNPAIHNNLANKIEENYITRGELESRFTSIESTLIELKADIRELLAELRSR